MIHIELIEPKDCKHIVQWNKDKDEEFLFQWAGHKAYSYPITTEQIKKRINNKGIFIYKIINCDEIIGTVELSNLDPDDLSIMVGRFLIKEDERGKGYGEETLKIIAEKVFHEMNLKILALGVYTFNHDAIRCYKRAGFIIDSLNRKPENPKWNSYTMISKSI